MTGLVAKQSISSLISNTVKIYRLYFWQFILICATFLGPIGLASDLLNFAFGGNDILHATTFLFVMFFLFFANFLIVGETSEVCLGGYASFSKALLRVSFRGVGGYVGTEFLGFFLLILIIVGGIVLGVLCNWVLNWTDFPLYVKLTISLLVYFGWFFFCFSKIIYIPPVVALERLFFWRAVKRSFQIAGFRKWLAYRDTFFLLILQLLFVLLGDLLFAIIVYFMESDPSLDLLWYWGSTNPADLTMLVFNLSLSVFTIFWVSLQSIFLTLAYYNLRITAKDLTVDELVEARTYEAV